MELIGGRQSSFEREGANDEPHRHDVGASVRAVRKKRGWTLTEASTRLGIGRSTLAKIESGQMSPTIGLLQKIAHGLRVEVQSLISRKASMPAAGRRSVTFAGTGETHETEFHVHEVLCADLSHKRMMPFHSRIKAGTAKSLPTWLRHEGEELVYVLDGRVTLYSEFYEPTELKRGDSVYLDGRMGHRLVANGNADAEVLFVVAE
jgi:transcriptional regulator with XRE-family HTH domain